MTIIEAIKKASAEATGQGEGAAKAVVDLSLLLHRHRDVLIEAVELLRELAAALKAVNEAERDAGDWFADKMVAAAQRLTGTRVRADAALAKLESAP